MADNLQKIQRFVVLMMENRSFDHLFGYLKTLDPRIVGLTGSEYANYPDPLTKQQPAVPVSSTAAFTMPFDPPHEFCDVQKQLYGPDPTGTLCSNPRVDPALMNGFLYTGTQAATAAKVPTQGFRVMECFAPGQVPCLMALAQEFALFNFWYSSLPGPTWPNRFFVHAATSGGLSDSPGTTDVTTGYSFKNDTIYQALSRAGKDWRIYHDGLPQTAGIDSLRLAYVDPFTSQFREMTYFAQDVQAGNLPEYTFIEPCYGGFLDTDFASGNSMHPQDDIRAGDALIKQVYETLRQSNYWQDTMLIITFDEHGGFFDHVPPPPAVPTGDDAKYANPADNFAFDRYGLRVPAVVISAYTQKGTVIGTDPADQTTMFDHTSILATVEARFGLAPLTARDKAANILDVALNLDNPRSDAPLTVGTSPTPT
jgi:phospholipase C